MVSAHTMVLIQPHLLRLNFTDKRRKLLGKAERSEKKMLSVKYCAHIDIVFQMEKRLEARLNILTETQTKAEFGWKPQRGHLAIVSPSCFIFWDDVWED